MAGTINEKSDRLGVDAKITRRDFVNGVLVGTASMALTSRATASAATADPLTPSGSAWTGYGGVGEYAWSNGNTEQVRDAAHQVRDGHYDEANTRAFDEIVDVVVVGGGFSGISAAYEFAKRGKAGLKLLLLDNHPALGGYAKPNALKVDDEILLAPQSSDVSRIPTPEDMGPRYRIFAEYWRELGLPTKFDLEPLAGGAEKFNLANDHYDPMLSDARYQTGYFFKDHGWSIDPAKVDFQNTPWSSEVRRELSDYMHNRRDVVSTIADADRWLDSITYRDLLKNLGYGDQVASYVDPVLGVANFGMCSDAVSAYAAKRLTLPGTIPSATQPRYDTDASISFPGGNSAILRSMLRRINPTAIRGGPDLETTMHSPLDLTALDAPGQDVRLRPAATVVRVEHIGKPGTAEAVAVTYVRDGQMRRVRARAVVMAVGGWIGKRVVRDLPPEHAAAYDSFVYGPVMSVNVAVRNWRFFDKLGFSTARWFEGFGWHVCVRRNIRSMTDPRPLTPDRPTILTFYVPFLFPGKPAAAQGALARQALLSTSYMEFERQVRAQMTEMFGSAGFDAKRDIAGIVLNRWGHAYLSPQPGFFFGSGTQPAPPDVIRRRHGRVLFAHSELQGNMNMAHGMLEGRRGMIEALDIL